MLNLYTVFFLEKAFNDSNIERCGALTFTTKLQVPQRRQFLSKHQQQEFMNVQLK